MVEIVDDYYDRLEVNRKNLEKKDQLAKESGELKGRYIQEPRADGYAIYEIVRVNKRSVRIKVVTDIGDDWTVPFWGEETTIPLDYAERNIRSRDALAEMFSKHKQQLSKD